MQSWGSYDRRLRQSGVLALGCLFAAGRIWAQAGEYRGLWVGEATLNAVNEVAVSYNADNVAVAPDPRVPTPTFDLASLRLLLHVNAVGQVFLLKDVAILNHALLDGQEVNGEAAREGDLALVTDPRLYADFPPQPALRIASAVFDFGDARASAALDEVVRRAARQATDFVMNPALELETPAQRVQARQDAVGAITPVLEDTVGNADVDAAFETFLDDFDRGALATIAGDPSAPDVALFRTQAEALRDRSFYADSRALEMVDAVVAAVETVRASGTFTMEEVERAAHNTASAFADSDHQTPRLMAGRLFSDMLYAASDAAPAAANAPGADTNTVAAALRVLPETVTAGTEVLRIKVQRYDDTRGATAIDEMLDAIAVTAVAHSGMTDAAVVLLCQDAGRTVLNQQGTRYPRPLGAPTIDYNELVRSPAFVDAVDPVATAAAEAAIAARADDPLFRETSVYAAALVAATEAARGLYDQAARATRTELPLEGVFAQGSGDPRFVRDLPEPSDLGPAGIEGRILLAADHPTNPFRHRRHPDHSSGIRIERRVRLDFDDVTGEAVEIAGHGTQSISGTYREEILGLHKPLGPDPESEPIGLKVEGRFELHRISTVDTLNTL